MSAELLLDEEVAELGLGRAAEAVAGPALAAARRLRPAGDRPRAGRRAALPPPPPTPNWSRRLPLMGGVVLAADLAALAVAAGVGLAAARAAAAATGAAPAVGPVVGAAALLPVLAGNFLAGLYPATGVHAVVEFRQLTRVATVVGTATVLLAALADLPADWLAFLAAALPALVVAAPILRHLARRRAGRAAWWGCPALVFGTPEAAAAVIRSLRAAPESGLRPVGVLDPSARPGGRADVLGVPVLGTPRRTAAAARATGARYAIVAMAGLSRPEAARIVNRYATRVPTVLVTSAIAPVAHGLPSLWRDVRDCNGLVGVETRNRLLDPAPRLAKRATDVALASAAALAALPAAVVLAALVKLTSPGPVFYADARIGRAGRPFRAWKFRTMSVDANALLAAHLAACPAARAEYDREKKLKDDPRITRLGRVLRSTSLDEVPQLWNVLRGDMSLVGPRPILPAEVEKYGRVYQHYKGVRPGITGLWQVSGRNDTTYAERLHLVNYYVRNWSPWLDLHIIARTVAALVFRRGAY